MRYKYMMAIYGYTVAVIETDQPLHNENGELFTDDLIIRLEPNAKLYPWPPVVQPLAERASHPKAPQQ